MLPHTVAELDVVDHPVLAAQGIRLDVLRLDKLQPLSAGNKIFKLKNNIRHAQTEGYSALASFGGAYSNHIHALALAGQAAGMRTVGFIRGEPQAVLNDTLQDAVQAGMTLHYLSRSEYRQRNSPAWLASLEHRYPDAYFIPEGGSNSLGVQGCMEIVSHIQYHCGDDYDVVAVPCGTAATLAGLAAAAPDKKLWGFPVLKNAHFLEQTIQDYLAALGVRQATNWTLFHDYHGGGYAKINRQLALFIEAFEKNFNIPLEPVYSGKMFYGLQQLMLSSPELLGTLLPEGARVIAIHTGGMQGLRGMKDRLASLRGKTTC